MGFFDSIFGPSWADRVAVYMQDRRLPVEERIRLCVKHLIPQAGPSELAQGLPMSEIKKYLAVLENCDELTHLGMAMSTRAVAHAPVVLLKKPNEHQWHHSLISDRMMRANDSLRYRRIARNGFIIWCPIDESGKDLVEMP